MPCNCDHLEPTIKEQELQRTANLLVYVLTQLGWTVPEKIKRSAQDIYCSDESLVPRLCEIVKSLSLQDRNRIVFNAHDKNSRNLADWWEAHQAVDAAREKREKEEAATENLVKLALSKLTEEEKKALRLH